jgi:uncharacterized glyoxalase superfamily protein PhnB
MKLLGGIPVFSCQQIEATLAFYQQALQFVILNQRFSGESLQWVHLKSGDVAIMLERSPGDSAEGSNATGSRLYLHVDNAAELHHYLIARQFQPSDLSATDYRALEFDIHDPDGHRITIGQSNADQPDLREFTKQAARIMNLFIIRLECLLTHTKKTHI